MENLQRVNLLLERRQREALERTAIRKGRSVSDLVREYIALGMETEGIQQQERVRALENARALKQRILERRGGKPPVDAVEVINQMREERTNESLGSGR